MSNEEKKERKEHRDRTGNNERTADGTQRKKDMRGVRKDRKKDRNGVIQERMSKDSNKRQKDKPTTYAKKCRNTRKKGQHRHAKR